MKKDLKKDNFTRIAQQYFDIDYLDQLNEEDRAWLLEFMDATLANNHRDSFFKQFKNYKDKWKSLLDKETNLRNADLLANLQALHKNAKKSQELKEDYIASQEDLFLEFKRYSFEGYVEKRIDELTEELWNKSPKKRKEILKEFMYEYYKAKRFLACTVKNELSYLQILDEAVQDSTKAEDNKDMKIMFKDFIIKLDRLKYKKKPSGRRRSEGKN